MPIHYTRTSLAHWNIVINPSFVLQSSSLLERKTKLPTKASSTMLVFVALSNYGTPHSNKMRMHHTPPILSNHYNVMQTSFILD